MPRLDPTALLAVWEQGRHEAALDRALTLLSAAGAGRSEAGAWDLASRDVRLATVLAELAGPDVSTCVACAGCGAVLDVPVDVAALARSPVPARADGFHATVTGTTVAFRLPTTDDLRDLPGLSRSAARRVLVGRCTGRAAPEISDDLADAVEAAMADVAPAGAVEFDVGCPDCGATTVAALDVPALLWAEVDLRAVALLREVHTLAAAYGWTEADVLALSPARRAAYLELVGT
jgi:hypothetical protein